MRTIFFLLVSISSLHSGDEIEKISFYRGYIVWKEHFQKCTVMPYEFEQVIAGMRAAEKGDVYDQEDLQREIQNFRLQIALKQAKKNLEDAEAYLEKISKENDTLELIQNKLYYKQLRKGAEGVIKESDTPLLRFSLFRYNKEEQELLVREETPLPITIKYTIPGFAIGVVGMHQGEIRRLYIHPDLAYGTCGKLPPNQLLICEVEVVNGGAEKIVLQD